jgi:hypothetical protein
VLVWHCLSLLDEHADGSRGIEEGREAAYTRLLGAVLGARATGGTPCDDSRSASTPAVRPWACSWRWLGWADGKLQEAEKKGIRDAEKALNLPKELRDRIDSFMEKPVPLVDLKLDPLSSREREFAYVACVWMARVADGIDAKERSLLRDIGEALRITDGRQTELLKLAAQLRVPPKDEGWTKSIEQLFRAIPATVEKTNGECEVDFE